ncbi:MAG: outer membrane beta-barrel protein [Chitinophaga sp.]|uniref:outer membrane beta-barrel protein n=1 Tax=Chitinophaga sp. TaxID=1869181 RepID=UPI001B0171F5|nr:outer membrane beta-barrel protein [Chitinophaga sp.]MBO9732130.1 outer membrane beta-barrel protein [Chitinophaga sp.]
MYNGEQVLQSTNHERNQSNSDAKSLALEIGTRHMTAGDQRNRRPHQYQVDYSFIAAGNNTDKLQQSQFTAVEDPSQNKLFDRRYNMRSNDVKQHLGTTIGDLSIWLFGRLLRSMRMELYNSLDVNTHHETNEVADKDKSKDTYILNRYLTNDSRYTILDEKPALNLNRSFSKWLPNRYSKNWSIQLSAQAQFYQLQNHSDRDFQNINRSYRRFIPTADISYSNYQMGAFVDNYTMKFAASSQYPTASQLVPLVDSANQYYIQYGNVALKPADKKELSFGFNHFTIDRHSDFNYNLGVDIGMINNSFADSSITDQQGRSRHYLVNANGNRYLNGRGNVSKSFKLKEHQLQVSANTFIQINSTPNNIGGIWNTSNNRISNSQLQLYYSFKDIFSAILVQRFSWYHAKQDGINANELRNRTNETSFSASANCTKRLSLSSNINLNQSKASQSRAINFTIWNAYASYRFMKGNNLELKLSALDLLHQNTSIINYGSANIIRYGTTSVLQQYFMVGIGWYPRKFGKRNAEME